MPDESISLTSPTVPAVEVIRSEERITSTTERVPVEIVRLTKRIVTEMHTVEIELRHEELAVERIPLTEDDPVASGGDPQQVLTLVLHDETPEIALRVVPRELVHVRVEPRSGEQAISAELRHEKIEGCTRPVN